MRTGTVTRTVFAELSEVLPWQTPLSAAEIRAYYDKNYAGHGAAMRHAAEILQYSREKGYMLGLLTNGYKELQDGKIDLLGLRGYFKTIVISEEAGIRKPDPAIYKLALERLGASAEQTLFIGDHPVNDIWGPARREWTPSGSSGTTRGMKVWMCSRGEPLMSWMS